MKPQISILLGSGFSVPAGLRNVSQLNERLKAINQDEIQIHTSGTAVFLNGQKDLNSWSRWDERIFLQEFLEFYNTEILKRSEFFNYETFYDFYSGYRFDHTTKESIDRFYDKFNAAHNLGALRGRDCLNRVEDFNRTFNQLLASLLHKSDYWEDVSSSNYPPYDSFLSFLRAIVKTHDVKIHSLNYDLLFDWLGRSVLSEHFSDGFQLAGSPYYGVLSQAFPQLNAGQINKTYRVKLETFVDKFDSAICFYKLHGSISHKVIYTQRERWPTVRLKANYGISGYYLEVYNDQTKQYKFEQLFDQVSPDFLSGTNTKLRYYTNDEYYINLFKHFQSNLESSQLLIVIGYGFKDPGINRFIEDNYLSTGRPMFVIDPYRPVCPLFEKYSITFIEKDVTDVSFKEYLNMQSLISG